VDAMNPAAERCRVALELFETGVERRSSGGGSGGRSSAVSPCPFAPNLFASSGLERDICEPARLAVARIEALGANRGRDLVADLARHLATSVSGSH